MNTSLKNLGDEELLYVYRTKKNTEVIGILYNRYAHLVYGVCMKYLKDAENAKDATMQIFEKLITEISKHDIQLFKAWIYRVAQNHCFMILRSNHHDTKLFDEFPESTMEYEDNLHPMIEKENLLTKMEEALEDLNEEQKRCINLFYLEKKTYTEIMQLTGFNFMQVKSYIQNGKRNLKMKLSEKLTNE